MKVCIVLALTMLQSLLIAQQKPKIVYVADPLCSWCYGFQVEIDQVMEKYKDVANFEILVGGMGTENKKTVTPEFAGSLQLHWAEVKEETGQKFDPKILKTKGLIYNSEPICRAIVTAKSMDSTKGILVHKTLQKAFFAENKNVTQLSEIQPYMAQLGLDTALFAQKYVSEEMRLATKKEFDRVDNNGIDGFPVLLLVSEKKTVVITDGYAKFKRINKKLKKRLR